MTDDIIKAFESYGYSTLESIAMASKEELMKTRIGERRVDLIIANAKSRGEICFDNRYNIKIHQTKSDILIQFQSLRGDSPMVCTFT